MTSRTPSSRSRTAVASALVLAGIVSVASAAPAEGPTPISLEDLDVRRWEYIVLVRVSRAYANPLGRAETAALRAGGAVLESARDEVGPQHADHRLLIRTRSPDTIQEVIRAMRSVPGIMGANMVQLPETPTYAGGPEFITSYTGDLDTNPGDPRVIVRHDVPPVLDKRDLLENVPLPAGPTTGNTGTGGFTLNVSELFKRMKESNWRKREERMKRAPLPILPSEPQAGEAEGSESP